MKIAKLVILTVSIFAFVSGVYSQDRKGDEPGSKSTMSSLAFMEGDWAGGGWILRGRERNEFKIEESFSRKLGGSVIVVDGLGKKIDASTGIEKIIHSAYGIFYYDYEKKAIAFRYFKEDAKGGLSYPEFMQSVCECLRIQMRLRI